MKRLFAISYLFLGGCAAQEYRRDIKIAYTDNYIEQLRSENRALVKQVDALAVENARMEVALEWYKSKREAK